MFLPALPREAARASAMQRVLRTFFGGSAKEAIAAFLDPNAFEMSREDLEDCRACRAREKGCAMNLLAVAIFVAQATLVFAFGAGLLVLMRSSAASSRRLVCLLTLSGACIAPIVALFAPSWLTFAPEPPRFLVRAAAVANAGSNGSGWISLPLSSGP